MKQVTLFLIVLAALIMWRCNQYKEIIQPDLPTPAELIHKAKLGEEVSVTIVNAVREKMLSDLIKSDQQGQEKTANPGPQDTTGINAIFQLYRIPSSDVSFNIAYRLKIFTGQAEPYIYSMCFIVRHSYALEAINASVKFEKYNNYVDFPPPGVGTSGLLHNTTANATYFVFFSLQPFQLTWADKIILDMWYYNYMPGTQHWITVDRSDPNNFALSSDGYTNYTTYFFPDTLYLN